MPPMHSRRMLPKLQNLHYMLTKKKTKKQKQKQKQKTKTKTKNKNKKFFFAFLKLIRVQTVR